MSVIAPHSRR